MFQAGDWSKRVNTIRLLDSKCREVTNSIAELRATEWRREERTWQDELLQQPRDDEEKCNIQKLYSNYKASKNVNPDRIPGTCEWFLGHPYFLAWRELQRSGLLWLSADPGCGKSVLSKYLVDRKGEVLTVNDDMPIPCYFFFKDGDVNRNNAAQAICTFLYQLIMQSSLLYQYAKEDFEHKNDQFLVDFDTLWKIFLKAVEDPSSPEIICVLDALDECQSSSREALIAKTVDLYSPGSLTSSWKPMLKFLVTSRPEFGVVRNFKGLTNTLSEVRLRGEQESEQTSREFDLVIHSRVEDLGRMMDLSEPNKENLLKMLCSIPHRTYLWLYLTLDAITKNLELTKDMIDVIADTIPEDVNQAYTAILDKSPDRERARKLLHIILAARRPLTLDEANVALEMKECYTAYKEIDFWSQEVAEDRIKNICGLFLTVVDKRVYLIHQTAREFLECKEETYSTFALRALPLPDWKSSFSAAQSNL